MMMKNYPLLATTAFLLIVLSCKKDQKINSSELFYSWEVKNFMSIESVAYPKNENKKILLTFDKSGTFLLSLDINHCGGNFTTGQNSQLEMESPACTEVCCDSAFSEKLATTISKVTSYSIEGTTLKLHVPLWGYIECELDK
ncbi:MAG: META domain-containing protein [Prolixibacteraceae bacterium]|jgi:hypothetical protein